MTTADLTKSRKYTPDEIEAALRAYAATGNATEIARGLGCDEGTIRHWRNNLYAERYEQIREEMGPKLEELATERARQLVVQATSKASELIARINPDQLEQRDLAGAARNAMTAAALSNDKIVGPNTGRPTAVIQHRTLDEYLGELTRRYPDAIKVVNSTAEDVTEHAAVPRPSAVKRASEQAAS
jgi:hypothetical protein